MTPTTQDKSIICDKYNMMKYYGIYKITNKVNGKMYIGQHTTGGYIGCSGYIWRFKKQQSNNEVD